MLESDSENSVDDGEMGISGKYLIVGHLPAGWKDLNNYENRMKTAWGDHFVSLNEIEGDLTSREYREAVAEAVYSKLIEMGYVDLF